LLRRAFVNTLRISTTTITIEMQIIGTEKLENRDIEFFQVNYSLSFTMAL